MNYSNVFPDGDGFKYRVMIAREFFERGGFATDVEAAWECDKVRLWADDLCGRKVQYNFPERIATISDGEYENPPIEVSLFLSQLREKRGKTPQFHTAEEAVRLRNEMFGTVTPEQAALQRTALQELNDALHKFVREALALRLPAKRAETLIKSAHATQGEVLLALASLPPAS